MHTGQDYWMNYMEKWFGEELIEKWQKNVQLVKLKSNQSEINLEIFDTGDKNAPTLVFAHGIAGYARVLLPFVMPLFERGCNIVLPDMQGYGYNAGLKGDFEWNIHKKNLIDTLLYARNRFDGRLILGGASMGGPLAYAAACECPYVDALACWCLWDFSDREFMQKETNTKKGTYLLVPIFRLLSKAIGGMRIRTFHLVSYNTLTDSAEFNEMIKKDPQAGTHITLRGAVSLILQSKPATEHEAFTKPVLIVQPEQDRMTPKHYTERVFSKLGSKNKRYVEITGAPHFPTNKEAYEKWAEEVQQFIEGLE